MKIAIQGNPIRGKEVIEILECLGGINRMNHKGCYDEYFYYISIDNNTIVWTSVRPIHLSIFTLDEFEKEFPFKIGDEVIFPVKVGWVSGKITGLTYVEDQLKYEVYTRTSGYRYVEPHKLSLYPMKEERNITLTLDKAKEWYKKGGELKEIALQAFSEKELNSLPRSWEEFCKNYPIEKGEAHIDSLSKIIEHRYSSNRDILDDKNVYPSKKSAEAHLAMIQLERLRNCWWSNWEPEWNASHKYAIKNTQSEITIIGCSTVAAFLVFPTREMAEEFLKCFRDLIEQAGDLI